MNHSVNHSVNAPLNPSVNAPLNAPLNPSLNASLNHQTEPRLATPLLATDEPICETGKLACGNGECIDKELFCNGEPNCGDGSDENACSEYFRRHRHSPHLFLLLDDRLSSDSTKIIIHDNTCQLSF